MTLLFVISAIIFVDIGVAYLYAYCKGWEKASEILTTIDIAVFVVIANMALIRLCIELMN